MRQCLDVVSLDIEARNKREVEYKAQLEASSKKVKDME